MSDLDLPPEARVRRLYGDLADYAEDFCRTARSHGVEAARTFLGAYAEWLGVDLADAIVQLPPDAWPDLDARADGLLDACNAYVGCGEPDLLAEVEALGVAARRRAGGGRGGAVRRVPPKAGGTPAGC